MKGKNYQKKPQKKKPQTKTYQAVNSIKKTFKPCHTGNSAIFQYGNANLFAGGWTRRGSPRHSWAVIDLANINYRTHQDDMHQMSANNRAAESAFAATLRSAERYDVGPHLDFPIPDYGIPDFGREVWINLANDVMALMDNGVNVYVGCVGGHGRTGLAVSILAALIRPDLTLDNPIEWLRGIYCERAVETNEQVKYVFDILDLKMPAHMAMEPEWWAKYQYQDMHDYDKMASAHVRSISDSTDDDMLPYENEAAYRREQAIMLVCQRCQGFGYETLEDDTTVMCEECDGFGTL